MEARQAILRGQVDWRCEGEPGPVEAGGSGAESQRHRIHRMTGVCRVHGRESSYRPRDRLFRSEFLFDQLDKSETHAKTGHFQFKRGLNGADLVENHRNGEEERDDRETAENSGDSSGD
jgi:hypothetical protein